MYRLLFISGVQPPVPLEAALVDDPQQEPRPPLSILRQGLLSEASADQTSADSLRRQTFQVQIL